MKKTLSPGPRHQTPAEELANSVSHGVGLVGALIGAPVLLASVFRNGSARDIAGAGVFAGTMILLYLASTLYHALRGERTKRILRMFDHGAIFLLIAGTYTPFTLGVLRGAWGWTLLGLIWTLAILGVIMKATGGMRHPRLSTGLYLAMGWLAVIAVRPLWIGMPLEGLLWLAGGGLAYTGGVAFYSAKHVRYSHFVWHLFVVLGTTCHYFAVLWYAV